MTRLATVQSLCLAGCAAAPQPTQASGPPHSTPLKFEPAPVAKQAGQDLDSLRWQWNLKRSGSPVNVRQPPRTAPTILTALRFGIESSAARLLRRYSGVLARNFGRVMSGSGHSGPEPATRNDTIPTPPPVRRSDNTTARCLIPGLRGAVPIPTARSMQQALSGTLLANLTAPRRNFLSCYRL